MIGFLHVPKTGGTSLRTAFESAGFTVWRPRGDRYTATAHPPDGVDVVTGHIPFDVFAALEFSTTVTVLRDPVERWLSHHFAEAAGVTPQPVPENLTCRMLTSFDGPVDVAAAFANLAGFDVVGFTDRLDDLFAFFGLEPAHERIRVDLPSVSDGLMAAAVEANQFDIRLYQEARR